ncbi:hypothetical protein J3Q64DRAFT_1818121 [Phycomyces blakesleeanus]|uniref:Anaphase-promoting complex subunit 1 n=2 Tax=Phycomyces blakesleeanus TaxID=4837 RepID=A0ABR3BGE1_PHYBL
MLQELKAFEPCGETHIKRNGHLVKPIKNPEIFSFKDIMRDHIPEERKSQHIYSLQAVNNASFIPLGDSPNDEKLHYFTDSKSMASKLMRDDTDSDLEDEVYISNTTVTWSRGNTVLKTLKYDSEKRPINIALFAWFPFECLKKDNQEHFEPYLGWDRLKTQKTHNESNTIHRVFRKALCVVLDKHMQIYFIDGSSYGFPLPFPISQACALDIGILLQKKQKHGTNEKTMDIDDQETDFIAITNIEDIATKILMPGEYHELIPDSSVVNNTLPLIVTFNQKECAHYIWSYTSKKEVYPDKIKQQQRSPKQTPFAASPAQSSFKMHNYDKKLGQATSVKSISTVDKRFQYNEDNSTLRFHLLWKESPSESTLVKYHIANSRAFIVDNLDGTQLLCIMDHHKCSLTAFSINKLGNMEDPRVFKQSTTSALPICATRAGLNDMILVQNNSIALLTDIYAKDSNIILELPPNRHGMIIEDLRDAVNNRFNIVFSNHQIVRFMIDFAPRSCLARDCMAAMNCALPKTMFSKFKAALIQRYSNIAILHLFGKHRTEFEWKSFVITTLSFLKIKKYQTNFPYISSKNKEINEWIECAIQVKNNELPGYMEHVYRIVKSLHLLYEDYRLAKMRTYLLSDIKNLLCCLCNLLKEPDWIHYYAPNDQENFLWTEYYIEYKSLKGSLGKPVNIESLLERLLDTKNLALYSTELQDYPEINVENGIGQNTYGSYIEKLSSLYICLIQCSGDPIDVVLFMSKDWSYGDIKVIKDTIAQPVVSILDTLKSGAPLNLPIQAYSLIGRDDIVKQIQNSGTTVDPNSKVFRFFEDEPYAPKNMQTIYDNILNEFSSSGNIYGTDTLNKETEKSRFGYVGLVEKVRIKLDITKINEIRVENMENLSAEDAEKEQQMHAFSFAQRTMSQVVGQAIYSYGTYRPDVAQPFPFESINLSIKILPLKRIVEIEEETLSSTSLVWPNFHMGVCAGLRIKPDSDINKTWIKQLDPVETGPEHGGLFLALGLNGSLSQLTSTSWYGYIAETSGLVTAGFLLGLAIAYRGGGNIAVVKLLSMHIPSLVKDDLPYSSEPIITRAVCTIGLGLVHMGSRDRRMVAALMNELGVHAPNSNTVSSKNLDCVGLAAGFAIGFITLGKQGTSIVLPDMDLEDKLYQLMEGEPLTNRNRTQSDIGGLSHSNLDATGPGAIMALALMFLKTGDKRVAKRIYGRQLEYHINSIRPDILLLRVLAKNLILWDDIRPTDIWLYQQLPEFILHDFDENRKASWEVQVRKQAKYHIVGGGCLAIGLKYAGSRNTNAFECLLKQLDIFIELSEKIAVGFQERITKCAISTCINIIATASAMVMAGTGNLELFTRLSKLRNLPENIENYGNQMAIHMAIGLLYAGLGGYTLKTDNESIAGLLCAFYPFYPTSSTDNHQHLQSFRHFWTFALDSRWLTPFDVDEQKPCHVPIVLTVTGDNLIDEKTDILPKEIQMVAPVVLPPRKYISNIKLNSPEYWPLCINVDEDGVYQRSIRSRGILYVQKKKRPCM